MTIQTIHWSDGIWTNPPVSSRVDRERLIVEAAEQSDYWQQTMYGFQHDSGHALLHSWERQHAAEVSFKPPIHTRTGHCLLCLSGLKKRSPFARRGLMMP